MDVFRGHRKSSQKPSELIHLLNSVNSLKFSECTFSYFQNTGKSWKILFTLIMPKPLNFQHFSEICFEFTSLYHKLFEFLCKFVVILHVSLVVVVVAAAFNVVIAISVVAVNVVLNASPFIAVVLVFIVLVVRSSVFVVIVVAAVFARHVIGGCEVVLSLLLLLLLLLLLSLLSSLLYHAVFFARDNWLPVCVFEDAVGFFLSPFYYHGYTIDPLRI